MPPKVVPPYRTSKFVLATITLLALLSFRFNAGFLEFWRSANDLPRLRLVPAVVAAATPPPPPAAAAAAATATTTTTTTTTAASQRRCFPENLLSAEYFGSARDCSHLYAAGMQASASTLVYQLLAAIVDEFARADGADGGNPRKSPVMVEKVHRIPHCDARRCSSKKCAIVSYRDFRDVVCSHARRTSGCSTQKPCTAAGLESAVRREVDSIFFEKEDWATRLKNYRDQGIVLIKFEDFVDCPEELAMMLMHWLGILESTPITVSATAAALAATTTTTTESSPSSSSLTKTTIAKEQTAMRTGVHEEATDGVNLARAVAFAKALAAEFSIERNAARAAALSGGFSQHDRSGIHGDHISNGGRSGGW